MLTYKHGKTNLGWGVWIHDEALPRRVLCWGMDREDEAKSVAESHQEAYAAGLADGAKAEE